MTTPSATALESLVSAIVPQTRDDSRSRLELVSHCWDILSRCAIWKLEHQTQYITYLQSHIGRNQDQDLGYLADQIKRHCKACLTMVNRR